MFRSASFFIGTSFTVAVFTIFATSNVDSIVGIPHKKIFNANNFNPHKKPISLLNVLICTQGMQRTWWPEAGTIIVTGPYWKWNWNWKLLIYLLFKKHCIQYISIWKIVLDLVKGTWHHNFMAGFRTLLWANACSLWSGIKSWPGVYSGWSDVDGSSQLRLCHTCIIDVM